MRFLRYNKNHRCELFYNFSGTNKSQDKNSDEINLSLREQLTELKLTLTTMIRQIKFSKKKEKLKK